MKSRNVDYDGLLAEPMHVPGLLSGDEEIGKWARDQATKTILLFCHFGVDPTADDSWRQLALALARKHVPGFGPPPHPQGR